MNDFKDLAKWILLGLIALIVIDAFTGGSVLARYEAWRAAASASGGGETGEVRIAPQPAVIEFVEPEVIYTGAVEMRPGTAVSSPPPPAGGGDAEERV